MEDNFIQGSLFDDLELNQLQTEEFKEKKENSNKNIDDTLFSSSRFRFQ